MRWVRDGAGRLASRPHYDPDELDRECEARVAGFLRLRYGHTSYPLSTDDLTVLVERETDDLDLYADFGDGSDTEGVTEFFLDRKPRVQIARALSEDAAREPRLRTTLAHELGHVVFHSFLWKLEGIAIGKGSRPAAGSAGPIGPRCRRSTIVQARATDWLEWQAGYACGAFLMPASEVRAMAAGVYGPGAEPRCAPSRKGQALIRAVEQRFQVSHEAAQVRLQKLGLVPSLPYDRTQPRLLPAGTYAAGTYSARLLARRPFSHRG